MARRNSLVPRPIQPELINPGDTITATYPEDGGITVSKTGVVAAIQAHAGMRYFTTQTGDTIAHYTPGSPRLNIDFVLVDRPPAHGSMLEMLIESGRL